MPLLFLGIGLYCLIFSHKVKNLDPQTSKLLGGIMVVYGIFRGYRAYKQIQQEQEER